MEDFITMLNDIDKSERKYTNILQLSDVKYESNESYAEFYNRFRGTVCHFLKRSGSRINHMGGDIMLLDEIISPTFEDLILVWCLEKIDPKLPSITNIEFGEKLSDDDTTLKDIQEEIFQKIPLLLENCTLEIKYDDETLYKLSSLDVKNEKDNNENLLKNEAKVQIKEEGDNNTEMDANILTENILSDTEMKSDEISDIPSLEYIHDKREDVPKVSKTKPFQCQDCGKSFASNKGLIHHAKNHHMPIQQEYIQCVFCDNEFGSKISLDNHIETSHMLTLTCKKCNEIIKGQNKFENHLKDHHDEYHKKYCDLQRNAGPHTCLLCQKSLPSHSDLRNHILQHKNNKELDVQDAEPKKLTNAKDLTKHICDLCGKFFRLKHLKRHKKTHLVDNLHCIECDLTFQDRKTFVVHTRSHKPQQKKAFCDKCGQTFTQESTLKSHMKLHLSEKMKCSTCKRSFYDKQELGSHVCKHYGCEICGQKFLRARNLEIHKKCHEGQEVFSCDVCESLFLIKKKLTKHVRDQHKTEKKYKCYLCEKRFLLKSGLTSHMLTHTGEKPFKCEDCGLRFTQKGNLDTHRKLHTTDEMPHQCTGCHAKFRQAGELKRHRESKKCGFSNEDFYSSHLNANGMNVES